ncbi:MAG TPA: helix-turn-helix domain-containing protein [Blastocatellia bacterium]|nr:helix-turn-helix domain-containing protein [Blastocatellia bacterium]
MDLNLKVIFGMKLKQFRERAGLSVTDFAGRTGLSTSYLTEIEHGKKYPKAEKIAKMAEALGRDYDDLVSLRLDEGLSPLAGFLSSPILHNFPYHLFGISQAEVVDLMTRQPLEASALVKALVGIAEQYNIGVEHLFRSALRSYQELHENYFPEIEKAQDEFVRQAKLSPAPTPSYSDLRALISAQFNYRLDERELGGHPKLMHFRSVLLEKDKHSRLLLVNPALSQQQKKFILAREIGYQVLGIKDRARTSPPEQIDSFEQVLGDFKASYFAGALLLPREPLIRDMKEFFALQRWQPDRFRSYLERYEVTPEIFMYRLAEVLPQFFGFKMHFLRFNHEADRFRLVKHLNMSEILIPSGIGLDEHYCPRWLAIRILSSLEARRKNPENVEPVADVQLSRFVDSETRFLCIALARHLALTPTATSSVSLGFRCDEVLERTIKFARDPSIARLEINGTCERCRLKADECGERAVPARLLELERVHHDIARELASLTS